MKISKNLFLALLGISMIVGCDETKKKTNEAVDSAVNTTEKMGKDLKGLAKDAASGIENAAEKVGASVVAFSEKAESAVSGWSEFGDLGSKVSSLGKASKEEIVAGANEIAEAAKKLTNSNLPESLNTPEIKSQMDVVNKNVNKLTALVKDPNASQQDLQNAVKDVENSYSDVKSEINSVFSDNPTSDMKGKANEAVEGAKSKATDAVNDAKSKATDAVNGAKDQANKAIDNAKNQANDAAAKAKEDAKKAAGNLLKNN